MSITDLLQRHGFEPKPQEEVDRLRKEREDRGSKQAGVKLFMNAGVPKRYEKCIETDGKYAKWAAKQVYIAGLLNTGALIGLCGPSGRGKTQLAVSAIHEMSHTHRLPSRYATATGFFMDIKFAYDNKVSEREMLLLYTEPQLLVIDEYGKRGSTPWHENLLFELINNRYGAMKDTILIDNRSTKQLEDASGDYIISRMNETGGMIECNWESLR